MATIADRDARLAEVEAAAAAASGRAEQAQAELAAAASELAATQDEIAAVRGEVAERAGVAEVEKAAQLAALHAELDAAQVWGAAVGLDFWLGAGREGCCMTGLEIGGVAGWWVCSWIGLGQVWSCLLWGGREVNANGVQQGAQQPTRCCRGHTACTAADKVPLHLACLPPCRSARLPLRQRSRMPSWQLR